MTASDTQATIQLLITSATTVACAWIAFKQVQANKKLDHAAKRREQEACKLSRVETKMTDIKTQIDNTNVGE